MATLSANTVVIKDNAPVSLFAGYEVPEWAADQVGGHIIEQADGEPEKPARRKAATTKAAEA